MTCYRLKVDFYFLKKVFFDFLNNIFYLPLRCVFVVRVFVLFHIILEKVEWFIHSVKKKKKKKKLFFCDSIHFVILLL